MNTISNHKFIRLLITRLVGALSKKLKRGISYIFPKSAVITYKLYVRNDIFTDPMKKYNPYSSKLIYETRCTLNFF